MKMTTLISPTLHPMQITSLDGYVANEVYVKTAADAYTAIYSAIEHVHDVREKLSVDVTRTQNAKVLAAADMADKYLAQLQGRMENSWNLLSANIQAADNKLNLPIEQYAGIGNVATEIRAHFKAMSNEDRRSAINSASRANDEKTLKSILGAPSYLSGVSELEHANYTRTFHLQNNPELAQRLELMKKVRGKLESIKPVLFKEMSKAIGRPADEVAKIREAARNAEIAIKPKNFD